LAANPRRSTPGNVIANPRRSASRDAWIRVALVFVLAIAIAACGGVRPATSPGDRPTPPSAPTGGINRLDQRDKPYLILVSFDGFRADYLDRFALPNFQRVMQRGARARGMVPVFPSLTFPNHYSLVTGLRPERHGIVGNSFYDAARNQSYSLSNRPAVSDGTWYRGEPIWVTAERQGIVSACYFWPGSEAAIKGIRPTYWKEYDGAVANAERVNGVLDWLRLPEERRPHVITLYFSEVDTVSHSGPLDSPAVAQAAMNVDHMLGLLLAGIESLPIRDRIYLVLTSDHGMIETSVSQTIRLDSLIDSDQIKTAYGGPVANLHVTGGRATAITVRNQINARLKQGRAYLREELPERYHYRADPRAGDVVVVMNEAWTLMASAPSSERKVERWGAHGWDPDVPGMRALFLITGPNIAPGTIVPEVENVDVYPLMTELLGLMAPRGIDGAPGVIWRQIRR
jgi:predicted AlkP superfamily pyrophosphatase or phosphodiesterase